MAADAHHVLGRPQVGRRTGQLEFTRQRPLARADLADIGVHTGHEGLGIGLGADAIGGPLLGHVTAIEEQARGAVLGGEGGTEVLGQQAEPLLAPEVDLPEPVARGVVALQEEGVAAAGGVDVRDAPLVDADLGRALETGDGALLLGRGGEGGARQGRTGQAKSRQDGGDPMAHVTSLPNALA